METFTTEIEGSTFTCHSLGVVASVGLDGRVSDILGRALKSSTGIDVRQIFGGEKGPSDLEVGVSIFQEVPVMIGRFREFLDWDQFTAFMFECIAECFIIKDGDPVSITDPEILDARKLQHYKLFGWYLECQLGPFIEWIAPIILSLLEENRVGNGGNGE